MEYILLAADNKTTPEGEVYRSAPKHGKADCTVTVDDDDFMKLMIGKLNPQRVSYYIYSYTKFNVNLFLSGIYDGKIES